MFLPLVLGTLIPTSFAMGQAEWVPDVWHLGYPDVIASGQEGGRPPAAGDRRVTLGPMEYWVARALGTADPDQPRVIEPTPIGLGTALSDRRQADSEIEEFRVALQLRPDDAASHYNRGRAWVDKGQMDAAIAEFRKALKLRPDDVPCHVGLGMALAGKGQTDAAIAEFREALRLQPNDPAAHIGLGTALAAKGQTDDAIAQFRAALKLRYDDALAHYDLGTALATIGDEDGAIAEFREALKLRPDDVHSYIGMGTMLAGKGQEEAAIAEFRKALKIQPDDVSAHYNLGTALASIGDINGAIAEYYEVIRLKPDHAWAFVGLGTALEAKGDFAGALAAFKTGHEMGSKTHGWPYPSDRWVSEAERMVKLEARLPALMRGEDRPANPEEAIGFAIVSRPKGFHATAARWYQYAFAKQPSLAADIASAARYFAATDAVKAGCGQTEEAQKPDEATRASLRKQALEWLRANLEWRTDQIKSGTPEARLEAQHILKFYQRDAALACVRGKAELAKLPEDERTAWGNFWAQVDEQLAKLTVQTNSHSR